MRSVLGKFIFRIKTIIVRERRVQRYFFAVPVYGLQTAIACRRHLFNVDLREGTPEFGLGGKSQLRTLFVWNAENSNKSNGQPRVIVYNNNTNNNNEH